MPILKDFRTTKEISLPSWPDSKVEIYDSVLVGQLVDLDLSAATDLKQVISTLPKFIKSWNFSDEEGVILPITLDNLGFLKPDDVQYLGEQIIAFAKETKKKPNT